MAATTMGVIRIDFGDASEGPLATLTIPAQLKRAGMEMKFIIDGASNPGPADTTLIRLLVRAQKIGKRLLQPGNPPLEEIANEENIGFLICDAPRAVDLSRP